MMIFSVMFILLAFEMAFGFIGYDCGSRQLNVTTLSLLDVGDCDIPESAVNISREYLQLLQINEYVETNVIQCKVEIHRTVYYCGMHSHISIVLNGENDYIADISRMACIDAHKNGLFKVNEVHVIHGLRVNQTTTHSILLAGYTSGDGTCDGAGYSDPFGSWKNVVVQGTVKITLTEQEAKVKIEPNTIHLKSGTTCSLSEGSCIDQEGGYSFWKPIPVSNCKFEHYSILFEGYANKTVDHDIFNNQIVYSLATRDITFALTAKGRELVCGYTIIKTEHPKLVIFETTKGENFASQEKLTVTNLDIFAYVNSKFVYVEKHIRSQMKLLYKDVITQKCKLEKQALKTSLSMATQAPDEFAFDLMKSPGYMAVIAGEVVHIIKCVPVEVKIEHGDSCYAELQVIRNNKTYFLNPRTHILKSTGTEIPCNRLLPSHYFVEGRWYKILPLPTEAQTPTVVKPLTRSTWKYTNPAELAASGIYSEKELDQLRERIMFPMEKPALLNDLAREMKGHPVASKGGNIFKLFNADITEKILEDTWNRMWTRFISFGTVSAGVIALVILFQLFKAMLEIIIQGYALHSVYGWSIHILGAIWSSLTHLLLHLAKNHTTTDDIELGEQNSSTNTSSNNTASTSPAPTNNSQLSVQNESPDGNSKKEDPKSQTSFFNMAH